VDGRGGAAVIRYSIEFVESFDAKLTTRLARFSEILEHPWCAVDPVTGLVRGPDQAQQAGVLNGSVRHGLLKPGVLAARSNAKRLT